MPFFFFFFIKQKRFFPTSLDVGGAEVGFRDGAAASAFRALSPVNSSFLHVFMRINSGEWRGIKKKMEGIESGQIGRHESPLKMQELPPTARDELRWQAALAQPVRDEVNRGWGGG